MCVYREYSSCVFLRRKRSVCGCALAGGSGRQIESSLLERGTMRPQPLSYLLFFPFRSFPLSSSSPSSYLLFPRPFRTDSVSISFLYTLAFLTAGLIHLICPFLLVICLIFLLSPFLPNSNALSLSLSLLTVGDTPFPVSILPLSLLTYHRTLATYMFVFAHSARLVPTCGCFPQLLHHPMHSLVIGVE